MADWVTIKVESAVKLESLQAADDADDGMFVHVLLTL